MLALPEAQEISRKILKSHQLLLLKILTEVQVLKVARKDPNNSAHFRSRHSTDSKQFHVISILEASHRKCCRSPQGFTRSYGSKLKALEKGERTWSWNITDGGGLMYPWFQDVLTLLRLVISCIMHPYGCHVWAGTYPTTSLQSRLKGASELRKAQLLHAALTDCHGVWNTAGTADWSVWKHGDISVINAEFTSFQSLSQTFPSSLGDFRPLPVIASQRPCIFGEWWWHVHDCEILSYPILTALSTTRLLSHKVGQKPPANIKLHHLQGCKKKWINKCVYIYIFINIIKCIYIIHIYIYIYLSTYSSIYLSIHSSIYMYIYIYTYVYMYLFIYLFIHLPISR